MRIRKKNRKDAAKKIKEKTQNSISFDKEKLNELLKIYDLDWNKVDTKNRKLNPVIHEIVHSEFLNKLSEIDIVISEKIPKNNDVKIEDKNFRKKNDPTQKEKSLQIRKFKLQFSSIKQETQNSFSWNDAINICGYLLPRNLRDEWIGDLLEIRTKMISEGWNSSLVNILTIVKLFLLCPVVLRIKVSDYLAPGKTEKPK